MTKVVLDSSALLAVIGKEPGYETVIPFLDGGLVSSVNITETITKMMHRGAPQALIEQVVGQLPITQCDFTSALASLAGFLTDKTQSYGLSLGDRACLALGITQNLPVLTKDKIWAGVELPIEIRIIR